MDGETGRATSAVEDGIRTAFMRTASPVRTNGRATASAGEAVSTTIGLNDLSSALDKPGAQRGIGAPAAVPYGAAVLRDSP